MNLVQRSSLHCERLPSPLSHSAPDDILTIEYKPPKDTFAYQCGLCDLSAHNVYSLLAHFIKVHDARQGWESIATELSSAVKQRELMNLIRNCVHYETAELACKMCGRVSSTRLGLQVHISKFHNKERLA